MAKWEALQSAGGSPNDVLIRVQRQEGGEEAQTVAVNKMREAVTELDPGVKNRADRSRRPESSCELARSGFIAVILSALGMLIYLWWRFEWFFMMGAIITLILDTTKMVGFFALFQLDFNLTAIAALLTAIGYSVNDKVVVYDRMRENMRVSINRAATRDCRYEYQSGARPLCLHIDDDVPVYAPDGNLGR